MLKPLSRMIFSTLLAVFLSRTAAGEPIELARGAGESEPQQPQVAIGADGAIHVVFGVGDRVRYRRSDDGGKTFRDPIDLPRVNHMSLGMRRGPRIAVSNRSICITAIGGEQGKGRDGDLLAIRSPDGGKNWKGPVRVNHVEAAAREGLHAMAAGPGGELCCVWLDLRNGKTEIWSAVSLDGGDSWPKEARVYKSPGGSVCECCHPSVAYDVQGRIRVLWRNSLAGARDMYVASSLDGGKSFSEAHKLGRGTWPLEACPMDGGAIAPAGEAAFVTAWRREKTVYLTSSAPGRDEKIANSATPKLDLGGETTLGPGEQPWIAATKDHVFVIWVKERGATLLLATRELTSESQSSVPLLELAAHAADPVIAAAPGGRGPVVAAWESRDGKDFTIQCRVIRGRQ